MGIAASCPPRSLRHSDTATMPELTEVIDTKPEEVSNDNDSGTDSDGDEDSIPELEEISGDAAGDGTAAAAVGTAGDDASKAKQAVERKRHERLCPNLVSNR